VVHLPVERGEPEWVVVEVRDGGPDPAARRTGTRGDSPELAVVAKRDDFDEIAERRRERIDELSPHILGIDPFAET
jgi:hypothetical protein